MDIPPEIYSIIPAGLKQDERIFRHYTSDEDEPAVSGRNSTLISEHVQLNMVFFAFYYLYLAEKVVAMNDEKYAEYRKAIKNYRSDKKIYEIIPFFDSSLYNLHFLTREEAQEVLDGVDDTSDIKLVKPAVEAAEPAKPAEFDEQAEPNDYIEANYNFHPEADEIAIPNETLYWLHAQLDSMDPVRQQKRIKMASYLLERITWRRRRLAIMMFAKANPPNNENEEEQNAPVAAGGAGVGKGGARRRKRHTKRQSTRCRKHRRTRKN